MSIVRVLSRGRGGWRVGHGSRNRHRAWLAPVRSRGTIPILDSARNRAREGCIVALQSSGHLVRFLLQPTPGDGRAACGRRGAHMWAGTSGMCCKATFDALHHAYWSASRLEAWSSRIRLVGRLLMAHSRLVGRLLMAHGAPSVLLPQPLPFFPAVGCQGGGGRFLVRMRHF